MVNTLIKPQQLEGLNLTGIAYWYVFDLLQLVALFSFLDNILFNNDHFSMLNYLSHYHWYQSVQNFNANRLRVKL